MNAQINEEGVLTFKALTMTRKIFDQLEERDPILSTLIGVVNPGGASWFIGQIGERLAKHRFTDVGEARFYDEACREMEEELAKAVEEKIMEVDGVHFRMAEKAEALARTLPQIFLK